MQKHMIHTYLPVSSNPRLTITNIQTMSTALREKFHSKRVVARLAHTCE